MSREIIAKLETGKTTHPRDIEALADALNQSPCWLLFGAEEHEFLQKLNETEEYLLKIFRKMSITDKKIAVRIIESLSKNNDNK